jgi:hypothetical protein
VFDLRAALLHDFLDMTDIGFAYWESNVAPPSSITNTLVSRHPLLQRHLKSEHDETKPDHPSWPSGPS